MLSSKHLAKPVRKPGKINLHHHLEKPLSKTDPSFILHLLLTSLLLVRSLAVISVITMAEISPTIKHLNSHNTSSTSSSISPRSLSPLTPWTIKYKTLSKAPDSNGIWDGYQTKEEFMVMHIR